MPGRGDRVIVWRAKAGEPMEAVWHYTGPDCSSAEEDGSDLNGGPLEQGRLHGDSLTLRERADRRWQGR